MSKFWITAYALVFILLAYTVIGTGGKVEAIRKIAPADIARRNWRILRYEGYSYGSWGNHGGKVWYHVANTDNPNIQYRIYVTMWNNELQYTYGEPEKLDRVSVDVK